MSVSTKVAGAPANPFARTSHQRVAMDWPIDKIRKILQPCYKHERKRGKTKFSSFICILSAQLRPDTEIEYWWVAHVFFQPPGAKDSVPKSRWNPSTKKICRRLLIDDLEGVGGGQDVWHLDGEHNLGLMRKCTAAEVAWIRENGA